MGVGSVGRVRVERGGHVEQHSELELGAVTVAFTFAGHTDVGAVRRVNEDSYLAAPPLYLVADGMGGHAFGDRASQAAVAAFADAFPTGDPARPSEVLDAVRAANIAVRALVAPGDDVVSGTTLAGMAFVTVGGTATPHWMAFNVGDSRIYGWDGRAFTRLSVDHSVVQELLDAGDLEPSAAATHPERNVVTRALGAEATVDADIWLLPAAGHQTFVLCSDGLTKELDDAEIARIIAFHDADPTEDRATLAERLVRAAVAAGGSDNVTVVVVESEVIGAFRSGGPDSGTDDDTRDRTGLPRHLEDTSPRR